MAKMQIECVKLVKNYRIEDREFRAVDEVSFTVAQGEFITILGHSGSGKTTLLSLIGGLARPDRGEVLIDTINCWEQNEAALAELRNHTIGFIFQFGSLIPTLTALENILLPLTFGGRTARSAGQVRQARELLDLVDLADKGNSFPAQLSGGQQRRVAIARAFINEPRIILADEPTGDLDEETEMEILKLFRQYNQQGTTFLVVTHNSHLATTQHQPRTFLMKNGRLSENTGKE
jgi:putative ABC transport system ATP-binding protein/lipoprotein-releasing system ATP-binding protein